MKIELVNCTAEYWDFMRILRNDKRVTDGFVEDIEITPDMQEKYMNKYAENYRIALIDNKPAGYAGVIENDIRVCTHPDYQGKGLGKFMINEIMKIWPDAFAKIKMNNEASIKLFEACGFSKKYFILTKD